jgi:hypothetical protein
VIRYLRLPIWYHLTASFYESLTLPQVVACRRVLKNSYIVGYYDIHSKTSAELYEMQQQMLESNTEILCGLTEKDELDSQDREHITNLTTVTNKFLEFMLKYHHNDDLVSNEEV